MRELIKETNMDRDNKGHFVKKDSEFTVCPTCLKEDWKNYYVDLT